MKKSSSIFSIVVSSLMAACGGGGGDAPSQAQANDTVVAPMPAESTPSQAEVKRFSVKAQFSGQISQLEYVFNGLARSVDSGVSEVIVSENVADGTPFTFSIKSNPTAQLCSADEPSGNITADTLIKISCSTATVVEQSFGSNPSGIWHPSTSTVLKEDGKIWGVTSSGGSSGKGGLYKVEQNGVASIVSSFPKYLDPISSPDMTNAGYVGLIDGSDGLMYSTSQGGGDFGAGQIFSVDQFGKIKTEYSFNSINDQWYGPRTSLSVNGNGKFYGILAGTNRPANGSGTVFEYSKADGLKTLFTFKNGEDPSYLGAAPISDGKNNVYGIYLKGNGYIYKINFDGVYSVVHNFGKFEGDGFGPLRFSKFGNSMMGTTVYGGKYGAGVLYVFDPELGVKNVYDFEVGSVPSNFYVALDGNVYVNTCEGGTYGKGSIIAINSSTWKAKTIYSFGAQSTSLTCPASPVNVDREGNMYGFAVSGGFFNKGGFYSIKR